MRAVGLLRDPGLHVARSPLHVAIGLSLILSIPFFLITSPWAPVDGQPILHVTTAGPDCIPCQQPAGYCWPNCCQSYSQYYVSNVVVRTNSTRGNTTVFTWSDTPSTARDLFTWWVYGNPTNHTISPSSHSVTLYGLTPYAKSYFQIDAYGTTCYYAGYYSGPFTPYYGHTIDTGPSRI